MKMGAGKKPPAFGKAAAPAARGRAGRSGKAPGAAPLAPPGLAPKMRGMSSMPRMMRKGGAVKGCK